MIAISHDYRRLTVPPKKANGLNSLYQFMVFIRRCFIADSVIEKPEDIHCSHREWNRHSAFIMAQYELAHDNQSVCK